MHGFSTRLTVTEAKQLEQQHGILSVKEDVIYKLHTTRSPDFLGLERTGMMVPRSITGGDVVVGVVDIGVWPGSKSLDDSGFPPIPESWKAYTAANGPIDEKLESMSPVDDNGHGTHTATTAAGSKVTGASFFGFAKGTARGMAPHARLAVYKACWVGGCHGSDILAAMEKAITDGVHVLSVSIGGTVSDYTNDFVAFGAFKVVSHGIFVACSADNSGPDPESLSNVAPWLATVGAGTLDRDFPAYITLGNGKRFRGVSLYSGKPLSGTLIELVFISNGTGHVDPVQALDPGLVYDASSDDYLSFLCALNYSSTSIKMFGGGNYTCGKKFRIQDLNYPSFAVPLLTASSTNSPTIVEYRRSLTNVGNPATYKVSVTSKVTAVNITVNPQELIFTKQGEKKVYTVTFSASSMQSGTKSFARLTWYVLFGPCIRSTGRSNTWKREGTG
ncbi:hypothetical protein LXL04_008018 [Taraxacum kok-saghyz]